MIREGREEDREFNRLERAHDKMAARLSELERFVEDFYDYAPRSLQLAYEAWKSKGQV